ncbi:hypothetical protein RHECNPAF_930082 [Rhizobium etli CNPAF512]|nr:hypothetical protein RHECNPAF_930082 [Rhizobium etli CNPAF512]
MVTRLPRSAGLAGMPHEKRRRISRPRSPIQPRGVLLFACICRRRLCTATAAISPCAMDTPS